MHPSSAATPRNLTYDRLQSLYELIGRMSAMDDPTELLEFIMDRALSLTHGHKGLVLLCDQHSNQLSEIATARNIPTDVYPLEEQLKFFSTTVIDDVLQQGQPRLISDLFHDQRYGNIKLHETGQFKNVRSVLAVPLKVGRQLVGLIYLDHPLKDSFGEADLEFIIAFANQAAVAVHRAREYQRKIQELTRLNALSRSVVQVLDLEEVLTRIVHEATHMLHVETGSVVLCHENKKELVFATSVSDGQRIEIPTHLRMDQGIAGWVVTHGQPAYINNVDDDPRWFGEVTDGFKTRSILCVPLMLNGRVLGALQVLNRISTKGFNEDDIALLSAFAASATIAIENAQLFQEARQAKQLRILHDATLALSSSFDHDKILRVGLEKTLTMLRHPAGAIILREHGCPRTVKSQGFDSTTPMPIAQREYLEQLSKPFFYGPTLESLLVDPDHPHSEPMCLRELGIETLMMVPLEVGGNIRGTLTIVNDEPYTYRSDKINLMASMAHILELALQNARNYDQIRTQALQLSYLNEIGSALTRSLDPTQVLRVIVEGVDALLDADRITIFLLDEQSQLYERYSTATTTNEFDRHIATWVMTHHQPVLISEGYGPVEGLDVTEMPAHQAILGVPIIIEQDSIGVVEAVSQRPFVEQDQAVLIKLSQWAAIAMHNATLYDERVQAYEQLAAEQKRRIAAETRGAMATIVLDMAHTMNNILGAIRVWSNSLEGRAKSRPSGYLSQYRTELTKIRQNTEEAIKLIANMTGPLDSVTLVSTDIELCLEKAIQSCWWPDNVHLHRHYAPHLPTALANPKRLETVFHNLIANATQVLAATGGNIFIETTHYQKQIQIKISDSGPGVPNKLQETMFNPGVSGKEGGLGIGLWLAETFVHQFQGEIYFTNAENYPTTFVVTLKTIDDVG